MGGVRVIGLAAVVADTRPWRRPAPAGEPPGDVGAIAASMSVERETAWPSTQLKRCRETRPAKGLLIGVEVVQPAGFYARSSSRHGFEPEVSLAVLPSIIGFGLSSVG